MRTLVVGAYLIVTVCILTAFPAQAQAGYFSLGVVVGEPPPPLPVYAQPWCPGDGYLWTPGYWAFDEDEGYYWVPGAWALPPQPGLLWTPGYWGWASGGFVWNEGYWGPRVGFYGGINYGFGYFGHGFNGGYWEGNRFRYNASVANINAYHSGASVYYGGGGTRTGGPRTSYNGGEGGVRAHPLADEQAAMREPHRGWTPAQRHHGDVARSLPGLAADANHGHPSITAVPRVGSLNERGVSLARDTRRIQQSNAAWAPSRPPLQGRAAESRNAGGWQDRPPAGSRGQRGQGPSGPSGHSEWTPRTDYGRPQDREMRRYLDRPRTPVQTWSQRQGGFENRLPASRPMPTWGSPHLSGPVPRSYSNPPRGGGAPPMRGPERAHR